MEKHHKLRRPPGSSIHGCNICGKEGHQAAVCPNGTSVNWPERFGPLWTVDLDALAAKQRRQGRGAKRRRIRLRIYMDDRAMLGGEVEPVVKELQGWHEWSEAVGLKENMERRGCRSRRS